jgi:hypothetical protein
MMFGIWAYVSQLWHIGFAAGLLALAGWLWFAAPIPFARYAAVGCIAVALFTFGRADGKRAAMADCQTGALRAALAGQRARAEELERQAAASSKIATDAAARTIDAERLATEAERKSDEYQAELAARPVDSRCTLDDADIRRLR